MNFKNLSLLLMLSIMTMGCLKSQEKAKIQNVSPEILKEKEKITETIEMYFDGWMTGDTTKIGAAMHRTCQLKNIKNDDVVIYDRATYLGFFKPRARRKNAGGKIVSVDITGDTASAKCEIHTEERLYTDYFNMMKLKDRWYIVDKIASNIVRPKKD